jgi:spore germination cell wall hydrolase CwlJ-like protein
VVLNRFRSGKWFAGKTIASTCLKAYQFSCWDVGDPNREKMCDATLADLDESQAAAVSAMLGTQSDPTDNCTHYHAVGIAPPPWTDGHTPHITIGRHSFYRGID